MRAFLLCLLLSSAAYADSITTKDGARHEGRILDTTDAGYVFRFEDGSSRLIRFEQVEAVQRSGEARPLADVPLAPEPPRELVPREERRSTLLLDWHRLRMELEDQPLGFPVTAVAVGGGALLVGSLLFVSYDGRYAINTDARQAAGIVMVAGGSLFVTGAIIGAIRLVRRSSLGTQIEALEREARALGIALPRE